MALRRQVITLQVEVVLDDTEDPDRTVWPFPPLWGDDLVSFIRDNVREGNFFVVGSQLVETEGAFKPRA